MDTHSRLFATSFAALVASLVVACGPAPTTDEPDGGPSEAPAACTARGESYVAGMSQSGEEGVLVVTLVTASPAPPDVGLNTWTLRVEDTDGASVADEEISARAWMPDHGHGTAPVAAAAEPSPGEYELNPFELFMAGFWEITVEVGPAGDVRDTAVFPFCAEG